MNRVTSKSSIRSGTTSQQTGAAAASMLQVQFVHNIPNVLHIIKEVDEHLTGVAAFNSTSSSVSDAERNAALLIDFDASAVSRGNVVHILPPSDGRNCARTLLAESALQQEKRLHFCWWVAATDAPLMDLSLASLCDAIDHSEAVSKLDRFSTVLQDYVEQQGEWGKCCVFVLEDCAADVLIDFLARLAPRWGAHIVVLPSVEGGPIDVAALATLCTEARQVRVPSPHQEDFELEEQRPIEDVVAERHKRRCEALIPHYHGGFVDESWLLKCVAGAQGGHCRPLLMRLCIAAMENFECDSYTLHAKVEVMRARLAKTVSPRAVCREETIGIAAVARVYCDSLSNPDDQRWFWAIIALPRMVPNAIVPEFVINLFAQCGLVAWHFCRGSMLRDPVTMVSFPSWLFRAIEHTSTPDEVRAAFATTIDKLEELTRLHLTAIVPLPQWSATSVEVTAVNARGDDVSVLTTALIGEGSDVFRESTQQQTWRLWGPDLIKYVVAATRRRLLFFPRIAQLIIPDTQRKLKINDVPELPPDTKEWSSKLVTKYIRQTRRLMEESRALEAASACEKVICVMLSIADRDVHANNTLLLLGIGHQYREIAEIYVKAKIEGLAETYVERAVALFEAIAKRRRDTPARAVPLLTSGQMMLQLSAAEKRRATLIRESAVLTADGSDMQLRMGVRAEVGEKQYLHEASKKLIEAASVLHNVPEGVVGAELALCHETMAHSHHAAHKDKEALVEAETALSSLIATKRASYTVASRPRPQTIITLRDEITWVQANVAVFVRAIIARDYKRANELLDRSLLLSHCVLVPSLHPQAHGALPATSTTKQVYVYCDGGEVKDRLVQNTFPAPRFFESVQLWATLSEATMAKHHGNDWQHTPHVYHIPAHELLKNCDAESAEATSLLRRILDTGVSPQCCSPHDGKTLLHIALERHMAAAVQVLVSHSAVDVEHRAPFVLSAQRRGLSTIATVERIPSQLATPIEACDDPLLLLTLLLQSKSPRDTFQRNCVSIVERLGLHEENNHLGNILAPGKIFHGEVLKLLTMGPDGGGRTITSETREKIAAFCPVSDLMRALAAVDDEHVAHVLAEKLHKAHAHDQLEAARLLCAAATAFIRAKRFACAQRLLDHFPINVEMLFWEDAAEYTTAINERKRKLREEARAIQLQHQQLHQAQVTAAAAAAAAAGDGNSPR